MKSMDLSRRVYAHRGSSARLPENTMAAFRAGLEDGANALELDVHATQDGAFVVCHDADGRRTAGTNRRIRAAKLAEVRSWDVGDARSGPLSVPLLAEVLEAFPAVPLSLDVKPADVWLVPALLALLARAAASERVILASFHAPVVHAVRAAAYPGPTGLTVSEVRLLRLLPAPLPWLRRMIHGDAALIPVAAGGVRLDRRRFIARCRRLGVRVDYWVVNEVEQARTLFARGATGVMSDRPAALAHLLSP